MQLTNRPKVVASVVALVIVIGVIGVVILPYLLSPASDPDAITVTLLHEAGVMIETNDTRIYIDTYCLQNQYANLLADVILVTHLHWDHYNGTLINELQKEDTVIMIPASESYEVELHDAIGVKPGDSVQVDNINITAFYMYTTGNYPNHPKSYNWTSYLIDINGFTIFHAGDALNMTELEQFAGQVDVAFLPIYSYGFYPVDSVAKLQPRYFIPTHFDEGQQHTYISAHAGDFAEVSDCEIICLNYWSSYSFQP
ncbi:MAG: MBL fold metallo-hydrolase [Candidatus Thorarchaeota archaeon]|jgi:L-ascorbate metabolism protein UlaG (beta-lactamase superfamily)